jgi:hypothetical protein
MCDEVGIKAAQFHRHLHPPAPHANEIGKAFDQWLMYVLNPPLPHAQTEGERRCRHCEMPLGNAAHFARPARLQCKQTCAKLPCLLKGRPMFDHTRGLIQVQGRYLRFVARQRRSADKAVKVPQHIWPTDHVRIQID